MKYKIMLILSIWTELSLCISSEENINLILFQYLSKFII